LCFGIRSGVDLLRNNFTTLKTNDDTDPLKTNSPTFNTNSFNAGAGIYYYGERHFIGLTAPRFIPSQLSKDDVFSNSKQVIHYYLIAGYVWKLNSLWDFKPGFALKYTQNAPVSADGNISFLFSDKIWFGFLYRHGSAAGANVVYNISKQLRVGYAYDYSITSMNRYNASSHEVVIGYDFIPVHKALKSPRYF
jgi:type IX secretion system PorP/SprF family membrane protein